MRTLSPQPRNQSLEPSNANGFSDFRFLTGIKSLLSIVVMLLNLIHVFRIGSALYPPLIVSTVILLIPTLLYDVLGLRTGPVRYIVLTLLTFMSGLMYAVLSYHVIMISLSDCVLFVLLLKVNR